MKGENRISLVLLFVLLFTNYVFADAISYEKNDGDATLYSLAKAVTDSTYIDNKYSAKSVWIPTSDIKIYKYNTTIQMRNAGNESDTPVPTLDSDNDAYYLSYYAEEYSEYDNLYATFKIPEGEKTYTNVATLVYKNAISYKGKKYDVKLDIAKVTKEGTKEQELRFHYASRGIISGSKYDITKYDGKIIPEVGTDSADMGSNKLQIDAKYSIIDSSTGSTVPVSGVFRIHDIDLNQGVFIKGFTPNNDNTYMTANISTVKYNTQNNGTYIYSDTAENLTSECHAYLLM